MACRWCDPRTPPTEGPPFASCGDPFPKSSWINLLCVVQQCTAIKSSIREHRQTIYKQSPFSFYGIRLTEIIVGLAFSYRMVRVDRRLIFSWHISFKSILIQT